MTGPAIRRPRPITIAHRAGNDLVRLREAERIGADLVEADVWAYRGRLEVRHLKRLGRTRLLWDRWKLAYRRAPKLLLPDLLGSAASDTQLMLDLKGADPHLPEAILQTAALHPGRPLTVCSQNWGLLAPLRGQPHVTVVHSVGSAQRLRLFLQLAEREQLEALSIHVRLLTPAVVEQLKQATPMVMAWPVRTNEQAAELLRWGVDGVISADLRLQEALVTMRAASNE